jgi:hypothetical protein
MDIGGGLERRKLICSFAECGKEEKRGVPRHHGNMPPGNSFPQICVVSMNSIVDNWMMAQEYLRVVAQSNHFS